MHKLDLTKLPEILDKVYTIASCAGEKILEVYNTDFSVESKQDNSPLTAADMVAHWLICHELEQLTPDIPILSEESVLISFEERQQWHQYWLVDPLDGTREFIKRNGEFSVNIALIEGYQSVLGVIYIPVGGYGYAAVRRQGACRISAGGNRTTIQVGKTEANAITIAGSRSHGNIRLHKFIDRFDSPEVLSVGSSLKFCLVAEGKADIYPRFGPTSEWDSAAAQCIVEEAGGIVVDKNFQPLRYNTKESLLNPHFLVVADPGFDWKSYL